MEEGDYTKRYTVTTRMTPALRWAMMRALAFTVSLTVMVKVTRNSVHPQTATFEEKAKLKRRNRTEILLFTSLTRTLLLPLGQLCSIRKAATDAHNI